MARAKKTSWKCIDCGERMSAKEDSCSYCGTLRRAPRVPATLKLNENPWYNRRMIQRPGDIYGRDDLAEEVYAIIGAPHPGSVSLIGDRKIGKSSLLNYVADHRTIGRHTLRGNIAERRTDGRALRLFSVQIDSSVTHTLTDFYNKVVRELDRREESRRFIAHSDRAHPMPLETIVQRMDEEGARLVIMVDEAELLVAGGEDRPDEEFKRRFDASSFKDLKMLADRYDVAFVTATERGLGRVLEESSSVRVRAEANAFEATFEKVRIPPLDPDSAEELILEPAGRVGLRREFEEHKNLILEIAGRFPLLIQIACSGLFKHLIKNPGSAPPHEAELERRLMIDAEPCFAGMLETFSREEMQVCTAVVQGSAISQTNTFRSLVERGYLETNSDEQIRISSKLFASYLAGKIIEGDTEIRGKLLESGGALQVGPWVLEEQIGEGGIGKVYRARHEVLQKIRAIKVLNPEHTKDEKFLQQFRNQARLWYVLSEEKPHPNIVKIYYIDTAGEYHFLEMEFVQGGDLRKWIDAGPLSKEFCLRIAVGIAEAMDHYWRKSHLIHRDIKPRNILIDEQAGGAAKLSDFDLAVALPDSSARKQNTRIVGSVDFMAPEQISCTGDVDIRADIYSLGVTIFEAVTGRLPREVSGTSALGIDKAFQAVLAKMRQPEREHRYRNPSELLEDLHALQRGESPPHAWADASKSTQLL